MSSFVLKNVFMDQKKTKPMICEREGASQGMGDDIFPSIPRVHSFDHRHDAENCHFVCFFQYGSRTVEKHGIVGLG